MREYYVERGWDPQTTQPSDERLKSLGLDIKAKRI